MLSSSRDAPLLPSEAAPSDGSSTDADSKNFRLAPFRHHNHNAVVNIAMRCCFGLADNIWNGTVLAAYLFHLGGNEYAGFAEAAMGIASLAVALPAGWAADRFSKAKVIFFGGLLVPIAIGLSATAAIWSSEHAEAKQS